MAGNSTTTKILEIKVNYDSAVKALAKYRESIDQINEKQKGLKKQFKDGKISSTEYYRTVEAGKLKIRENSEAISTLTKQVQNQMRVERSRQGSLQQLRSTLSNLTAMYDKMSRKERESAKGMNLQKKINSITIELKKAEEGTGRFYRSVGNYSKANNGLTKINQGFMNITRSVLGMLGIFSAKTFIQDIGRVGQSYEDQMAKVRSVTNATTEDFAVMDKEAKRLGMTTAFTASQAGEALENLTRNGFTAIQAAEVLEETLYLAQANRIDLGLAADIVTGQLNSFHLGVEEATRVSDVMSTTCANSATNIQLLSESLKNTAPIAYTLGISVEETNAALGTLAKNNLRGADAGTAMKQVLIGLSTTTQKSRKVYERWGIDVNQATIKQEGLIATLKKFKESGIVDAKNSVQELAQIFGRRAAPSALALLNSLDMLDEMYAKLGKDGEAAAGTTARMYDQSLSEYTKASKGLASAWEALKITIFESADGGLVGPINALAEGIRFVIANFKEFASLVIAFIEGFTLKKIVSKISASVATARQTILINAETTTAQLNTLAELELKQRQNVSMLEARAASASGEERKLIEQKLLIQRTQLAETEKNIVKAKEAEIVAVNKAASMSTATGWKKAMLTCGNAVKGFALTAKTALKSIGMIALFSMGMELVMGFIRVLSEAGNEFKGIVDEAMTLSQGVSKEALEEEKNLTDLFNILKYTSEETDEYKKAKDRLLDQYGSYLKGLVNEKGQILNLEEAYNRLTFAIKQNAKAKGIQQAREKVNAKYYEDMQKYMAVLRKSLIKVKRKVENDGYNADSMIEDIMNAAINQFTKGIDIPSQVQEYLKIFQKKYVLGDDMVESFKGEPHTPIATINRMTENTDAFNDGIKALEKYENEVRPARNASDKTLELAITMLERGLKRKEPNFTVSVINEDGSMSSEEVSVETAKNLLEKYKWEIHHRSGTVKEGSDIIGEQDFDFDFSDKDADKDADKMEQDAIKRLKKEIRNLNKMIADNAELRAQTINAKYDDEIESLRNKLKTEANLTIKARTAILKTIQVLEAQRRKELETNSISGLRKQFEEEVKINQLKLENVIKLSDEELRIRLENLKAEHEIALMEAETAYEDEDKKNQALLLLNQNYESERLKLIQEKEMHDQDLIKNEFEQRLLSLENQDTEERLHRKRFHEMNDEEFARDQETKLNRIGEFQAEKLRMEEEEAERSYNALVERGQLEGQTQAEYDMELEKSKQSMLEKQRNINDAYVKIENEKFQAIKTMTGGITNLLNVVGEKNKGLAIASKVITLAQIAIDTGRAISAGIAASAGVPFPGNLAAIATTVGTVLANIATAIATVKKAKFAKGGKVEGEGTATSDSIPAMLSNGEFVMTARATKMFEPLLVAMNNVGRGVPMQLAHSYDKIESANMLSQSFESAVTAIRPVVSVVEITDKQNRVEAIENLDNF